MNINENQWKPMKINANQWKQLKLNKDKWKPMNLNQMCSNPIKISWTFVYAAPFRINENQLEIDVFSQSCQKSLTPNRESIWFAQICSNQLKIDIVYAVKYSLNYQW